MNIVFEKERLFLNTEELPKIRQAYYIRDHTEVRTLTWMCALKCLLYHSEKLHLNIILHFQVLQKSRNLKKVFLIQEAAT
jgi:hypothetical protein